MTPEQWGSLAERFGLPLVMLALLVVGALRGWIYFRPHVVELQERLTQVTALFERERLDRIAAEASLAKFAGANAEVAEAVREVLTEIVQKEPGGTPRRGR